MNVVRNTEIIKQLAADHGFLLSGVAQVRKLKEEEDKLQSWLLNEYHGDMKYMANHFDLRLDPEKLVPGAKSIICLAYNYYNDIEMEGKTPKVAMYAHGKDYHKVIKKKLKTLWYEIKQKVSMNAVGRYFVDSGPVFERQWAKLAGLGWTGKNTLLVNPKAGSYFFLAEIICDLELIADEPMHDYCGTCTRCIDACPTDAIDQNGYLLKANQCISYFTIESHTDIPDTYKSNLDNWIFGCDICQQVCPWNKFSVPHNEKEFIPKVNFNEWDYEKWEAMSKEDFDTYFNDTPLKRMGFDRMQMILKHLNT